MTLRPFLLTLLLPAAMGAAAQDTAPDTAPADTTATMPGYEMLDEIVVKGERPVMQTDGAKLTYNVDEDPAAASSNALDMLKKVPQVSVDADGNIRLNGSTGFKLQVNGLDNPMLKQYAQQILEGMPANAIVKIEVITEPGAREDAEGTAGIINIITERTRSDDGFSGTASLRADNRGLTPSLFGTAKKDKFTLSANVNYQWGYRPQKFESETTTTYLDPSAAGTLRSTTGQQSKHHYAGGSLNMSWEPNPSNLFTGGADIFFIDAKLPTLYGTTAWYPGADGGSSAPLWSFSQDGTGSFKIFNLSANAAYRHNFGHEGHHLVFSYLFNFGRNDLSIDRRYTELTNYTPEYPAERQGNLTFDRGHTVQADYANDFNGEHHLLETGVKGIFRHNTALATYTYGDEGEALTPMPWLDSDIMQPQNIYAAYASYTGTFDRLGVVAGLRYELTRMGITDRKDSEKDFRNSLHDWVPNAALTWNFSPSSNLRLAYQMRISRPSISQVNPFQLSFNPYQMNMGNPDLTSERIHIVSLGYSSFGRVVGGNIGVEYTRADNAISSFTYLMDRDGLQTVVTSYANIGRRQEAALKGFLSWSIIQGMNLVVDGRLAYGSLKAPSEGYSNHGWSGNIGANWNYAVADVYKFSAYGSWHSRSLDVQGYSTGFYYYGISASRDFLASRNLTLSVSANNFLQKEMHFNNHTTAKGVDYRTRAANLETWNVGIALTWKFGSLNARVKKTGVEVTNDDINSSSNKGQGSAL